MRVEELMCVQDDVVVAPMELTMRGVCALWPHWLQSDSLNCYKLRGSLHKALIDCHGNTLYCDLV